MSVIQSPTIQAVGYLSVEFIDADSATTVNAGNVETVNIVPPAGFLYRIIAVELLISSPGGTSSGTHQFSLQSELEDIGVMYGANTHNATVRYNDQVWTDSSIRRPDGDAGESNAMRGKLIDSTNGLDIIYTNDTDQDQANPRTIRLWVEKIKTG